MANDRHLLLARSTKSRPRNLNGTSTWLAVVVAALAVGCGSSTPARPASTSSSTVQHATRPPAGKLHAAQRILAANERHYAHLFAAARRALGTERYPDAFAGLRAMNDPTSGAARLRDFRTAHNVANDLSYL